MNLVFIVAIVIVTLFLLAFITKRRFGVLGLALAAGAMLSNLWAVKLTPLVAQAGVVSDRPPLEVLVAATLVLLPAVLLLFSGPSYHDMPMRVGGAFCFALLATVFLMEPIGGTLVLMDQNMQVYDWLLQNRVYIVTGGLILAILDLLSLHTGIAPRPKSKKHR
jgi:hypothetical protein